MQSPLFTGTHLIELKSTDSTNRYATDLLRSSRPAEGTAIFAFQQSHGRGQQATSWESDTGKNLLLSVIYYPAFLEVSRHFMLNMAISMAVKEFFDLYIPDGVKIKWPNDIYYYDRKLGGILIQTSVTSERFNYAVIGLGLNINQEQFPEHLPNPVSLRNITAEHFNLSLLQKELFGCLESRYLMLRHVLQSELKAEYELHLYKKDKEVQYQPTYEQPATGIIRGIEEDGRLRLETPLGFQTFALKEIAFPL